MKTIQLLIFTLVINAFAIAPPKPPLNELPQDIIEDMKKYPLMYSHPKNPVIVKSNNQNRAKNFNSAIIENEQTIKIPVLCAQYADVPEPEWNIDQLQQKLFGSWETGSLTDYYREISYNQFRIDGTVYDWEILSENSAYYDRENKHMGDLLTELFTRYDNKIDFSQYDNDGPDYIPNSGDDDGYVDVILIVHSGVGAEETSGPEIWSNFSNYSFYTGEAFESNDLSIKNKPILLQDYCIVPAIQMDDMVEIGVIAHELGHAFALPDLYDQDHSSSGVGRWCLMGSGSWGGDGRSPEYPVHMSAWCKERLGWISPLVISGNHSGVTIPPVEEEPVAFKLWNDGNMAKFNYTNHLDYNEWVDKEYFLVENRQKTGFDRNLPGEGLLVWHVDHTVPDKNGNNEEYHKLVDLEEADGFDELDSFKNKGNAGDPFPGSENVETFNRYTHPNSEAYNGETSKVALYNIKQSDNNIIADLHTITTDLTFESYDLTGKSGLDNFLLPGDNLSIYVSIKNNGLSLEYVNATLTTIDPYVQIFDKIGAYGQIDRNSIVDNKTNPFGFSVSDDSPIHPITFTMEFETSDGYSAFFDFVINMEKNKILLVDDSGDEVDIEGNPIILYYTNALDQIDGIEYDVWSIEQKMNPTRFEMWEYDIIIWFTGSKNFTLSWNEMANFRNVMYLGGKIFFSGQNFGAHLLSESLPMYHDFFTDWMHARLISDTIEDTTSLRITGIPGNSISESFVPNLYISKGARNQTSPSVIKPDSLAEPLFYYNDVETDGCAAITYDGQYKMVYFAFSFESIGPLKNDDQVRVRVMKNVLDWLWQDKDNIVADVGAESKKLPNNFELYNNYPNPFNARTRISYKLNKAGRVKLSVYNMAGQKIHTLVDAEQQSGNHALYWNGKDNKNKQVSSGIYFVHLEFNKVLLIKKMALIK